MTVRFVAEVSSNHQQDLTRCLHFIDVAAEIGCDAVKYQLFTVDRMFTPLALTQNAVLRARSAWELPRSFLPSLAAHCHDRGIQFACTPFYLDAVAELQPHVDFYKIASYELLWDDLLQACAATHKPLVLSTGMATMREIDHAVSVLAQADCEDLTLLHCTSAYPTPVQECNLRAIETMQRRWPLPVGWSDHSRSDAVLYRAVHRWQASMVEFHLDLDGTGAEYRMGHCWLPAEIQATIEMIHAGEAADGHGRKEPLPGELPDRDWRRDPVDGLRPLRHVRGMPPLETPPEMLSECSS